jgi:hypothetical protein
MSYLVFFLSLLLLAAGGAGAYFSLDLLPTSMGVLYALAGAVAVAMAIPTFAIGLLIRRVNKLAAAVKAGQPIVAYPAPLPVQPPMEEIEAAAAASFPEGDEPSIGSSGEAPREDAILEPAPIDAAEDEPINENRAGHLPSLAAIEHAIETPEAPPSLIGRYSSGGANYMIFSDGSIEAETEEGAYKFDSMGDFKKYLAERRAAKG